MLTATVLLKRSCHIKESSNSAGEGGNSAHSHSESASGDSSGSDEMDENHVSSGPSAKARVNNEHILVNGVSESDSHSRDNSVSNAIDYSKALINDFGKHRSKGCFDSGQIWACYDYDFSSNRMILRLYVQIVDMLGDGDYNFRLHTNLLLPPGNPYWPELWEHEDLQTWIKAGLPVGCGIFKCASPRTKYLYHFLHQMRYENYCRSQFRIHPMKGEIWSLHKDTSIVKWASNQANHKNCKYEIVEVLGQGKSYRSTGVAWTKW
ncbi:hypothetical protein ACH5RR_033308 [Cinchona calisaya]|uniref:DUF3444 domain-containing protein n=1 Tax=Cinchona calisaya TaxID=153742 RepID=A0ABD2YMN0_9GENT